MAASQTQADASMPDATQAEGNNTDEANNAGNHGWPPKKRRFSQLKLIMSAEVQEKHLPKIKRATIRNYQTKLDAAVENLRDKVEQAASEFVKESRDNGVSDIELDTPFTKEPWTFELLKFK